MSKRDREGSDWQRIPPSKDTPDNPSKVRYLDEDKLDKAAIDSGNTALPRSVRK